jgi:hypothetical protein
VPHCSLKRNTKREKKGTRFTDKARGGIPNKHPNLLYVIVLTILSAVFSPEFVEIFANFFLKSSYSVPRKSSLKYFFLLSSLFLQNTVTGQ